MTMTNLKMLDFKIEKHLMYDDVVVLRTGSYRYTLNPTEVLGLLTQLSRLTNELLEELCQKHIKDTS